MELGSVGRVVPLFHINVQCSKRGDYSGRAGHPCSEVRIRKKKETRCVLSLAIHQLQHTLATPSGIKSKERYVVPLVTSNVRNVLVGCAVQISIFAISDKPSNRVPLRPPWLPNVRSFHLSMLDSSLDLLTLRAEQSWKRSVGRKWQRNEIVDHRINER